MSATIFPLRALPSPRFFPECEHCGLECWSLIRRGIRYLCLDCTGLVDDVCKAAHDDVIRLEGVTL